MKSRLALLAGAAAVLAAGLVLWSQLKRLDRERTVLFVTEAEQLDERLLGAVQQHVDSTATLISLVNGSTASLHDPFYALEPFRSTFQNVAVTLRSQTGGTLAYGLDVSIADAEAEEYVNLTTALWREELEGTMPNASTAEFPLVGLFTGKFAPARPAEAYWTLVQRAPFQNFPRIKAINLVHGDKPEILDTIERAVADPGHPFVGVRNPSNAPGEDWGALVFMAAANTPRPAVCFTLFGFKSLLTDAMRNIFDDGVELYMYDPLDARTLEPAFLQARRLMPEPEPSVDVPEVLLADLEARLASDASLLRHRADLRVGDKRWRVIVVGSDDFRPANSLALVLGCAGGALIIVAVCVDLVLRERSEERHLRALAESERATHRKVMGYLCHELRNPLHAVLYLTQELRDLQDDDGGHVPKPLPAQVPGTASGTPGPAISAISAVTTSVSVASPEAAARSKLMKQLEAAAGQLSTLVNDFLDDANDKALVMHLAPTNASEVVRDTMNQYRSLTRDMPALTVEMSLDSPAMAAALIDVDKVRLRQIVSNGVSNAVKVTDAGSVVASLALTPDGDWLCIRVTDTGCGLPAARAPGAPAKSLRGRVAHAGSLVLPAARMPSLKRGRRHSHTSGRNGGGNGNGDTLDLFEDFTQGDVVIANTTLKGKGVVSTSGLGLGIARRLAELMGGKVTLEDRTDGVRGAVFEAKFPFPSALHLDEADADAEARARVAAAQVARLATAPAPDAQLPDVLVALNCSATAARAAAGTGAGAGAEAATAAAGSDPAMLGEFLGALCVELAPGLGMEAVVLLLGDEAGLAGLRGRAGVVLVSDLDRDWAALGLGDGLAFVGVLAPEAQEPMEPSRAALATRGFVALAQARAPALRRELRHLWDAERRCLRPLKRVSVVACEDDPVLNHLLALALARVCGINCHVYFDGLDVLEHMADAQRFRPDVILCDIVMKHSSGDEVARALRSKGYDTPLLAVTGNGTEGDVTRYLQGGFSGVLVKPYKNQELEDAIVKLLRPHAQHALRPCTSIDIEAVP